MEENRKAYTDKETVKTYLSNIKLEKGEAAIFEKYKAHINNRNVMDIGIGGGRTTFHLSKLAGSYIGLDFSDEFIKQVKKVYTNVPNVKIEWGDARDLSAYAANSADFVLFSFNGIDYVPIADRNKILSECYRSLKQGGVLCFSFHNSRNVDMLYSFQMPKNPFKYFSEWQRKQKVKAINGPKEKYKNIDHFTLYDGGENFTVDTMYVKPEFQKSELEKLGFKILEFRETITGKELSDATLTQSITPWIYVVAQKT